MNDRLEFVRPTAAVSESNRFEELLDGPQALALLEAEFGIPTPDLRTLQRECRLFGIVCAGEELYPAFQWSDRRLITDLRDVLSVLTPHRSAWKILSWFSTENPLLDGARPADCLSLDAIAVSEAARAHLRTRRFDSATVSTSGHR